MDFAAIFPTLTAAQLHHLTELATRFVAARVISEGDSVFDCGANVGYHCADFASRVGPTGLVHAFEPNPELWDNFRDQPNVRLWPLAVGDRLSIEEFTLPLGHDQVGSLVDPRDFMGDIPVRMMTVIQVAIDDLREARARPISFVKIDVERHEAAALRGMRQTLIQYQPVVVFENNTPETEAVLAYAGFKTVSLLRRVSETLSLANVMALSEPRLAEWPALLPNAAELREIMDQVWQVHPPEFA